MLNKLFYFIVVSLFICPCSYAYKKETFKRTYIEIPEELNSKNDLRVRNGTNYNLDSNGSSSNSNSNKKVKTVQQTQRQNLNLPTHYNFKGYELAFSSGYFQNNGICSIDVDNKHPREYQVVAENIFNPSKLEFKKRVEAYLKKGCDIVVLDEKGKSVNYNNIENSNTSRFMYEATCFNGIGGVRGEYLVETGVLHYIFHYDFTKKEVKEFDKIKLTSYMQEKLQAQCPFFNKNKMTKKY